MKLNTGFVIAIIAGLFLLFLNSSTQISREAMPEFDGNVDSFMLTLKDHSDEAVVGDLYSIDVNVQNTLNEPGHMYVQCSILDKNQYTFLNEVGRQSFNVIDRNCKPNEPFTQTAKVDLSPQTGGTFEFTVQVPNTPDGKNVIYCSAYERCWSETQDPFESDAFTEDIIIIPKGGTPNLDEGNDVCTENNDCEGWLLSSKCVNGFCVDKEDLPKESSFDWPDFEGSNKLFDENKALLSFIAFFALFIGALAGFKEKKNE